MSCECSLFSMGNEQYVARKHTKKNREKVSCSLQSLHIDNTVVFVTKQYQRGFKYQKPKAMNYKTDTRLSSILTLHWTQLLFHGFLSDKAYEEYKQVTRSYGVTNTTH